MELVILIRADSKLGSRQNSTSLGWWREAREKIFWYYIEAFVISRAVPIPYKVEIEAGKRCLLMICAIKSKRFSSFWESNESRRLQSSDPRLFWLEHDWFNYIQIIHRVLIREPSFRYRDNFLSLRLCYARNSHNNNINVSHASLLLVKPKILWRNYWFQPDLNCFIAWIEFSFMDFLVLKLLSQSFRCILSARLLCKPILCSGMCHRCSVARMSDIDFSWNLSSPTFHVVAYFLLILIALTLEKSFQTSPSASYVLFRGKSLGNTILSIKLNLLLVKHKNTNLPQFN